jgi:hypothetical protein
LTALPNYGIQYAGTGSAISGSALTATSQVFNLQNTSSDVSGTTKTYTLFANIDASYTGSTYANLTVQAIDASTSSVLATLTASSASKSTQVQTFTVSAVTDVVIKVNYGVGLNVPQGSSAIVSKIGVSSGTYTATTLPTYNQFNYFWTPGGLYAVGTFNYPRTVTVAAVDANGLPLAISLQEQLNSYLASRREVNFTVQNIIPNYSPIDVQWTGYVAAGYTAATVQTNVNNAIRSFLSPSAWAGGTSTPQYWDGSANTVRVMDIAGVISATPGVASVASVLIRNSWPASTGTNPYASTDVVMAGVANLPVANTITGTMFTTPTSTYSGL